MKDNFRLFTEETSKLLNLEEGVSYKEVQEPATNVGTRDEFAGVLRMTGGSPMGEVEISSHQGDVFSIWVGGEEFWSYEDNGETTSIKSGKFMVDAYIKDQGFDVIKFLRYKQIDNFQNKMNKKDNSSLECRDSSTV